MKCTTPQTGAFGPQLDKVVDIICELKCILNCYLIPISFGPCPLHLKKGGPIFHLILDDHAYCLKSDLLFCQAMAVSFFQTREGLDTGIESLLACSSPTLEPSYLRGVVGAWSRYHSSLPPIAIVANGQLAWGPFVFESLLLVVISSEDGYVMVGRWMQTTNPNHLLGED